MEIKKKKKDIIHKLYKLNLKSLKIFIYFISNNNKIKYNTNKVNE